MSARPATQCAACGSEAKADDRFCANCGYELAQDYYECEKCGSDVEVGATSCSNCGDVFEEHDFDGARSHDLGTLAAWISVLFSAQAGYYLISLLLDVQFSALYSRASASDTNLIDSLSAIEGVVSLLFILVYIASVVLFVIWMSRAYKNLLYFRTTGLEHSPRWAVGSFFVPFANLVVPYRAVKEIWLASSPELDVSGSDSWKLQKVPAIIKWWWGLWLLSNFLDGRSAGASWNAKTPDELASAYSLDISIDILAFISAVVGLLVVRAVTDRQKNKLNTIGSPATEAALNDGRDLELQQPKQAIRDGAYAQQEVMTAQVTPNHTKQRHSGVGVASFVISLAASILVFIVVMILGAMEASMPGGIDEDSAGAVVLGLFLFALLLPILVALGLGIGGLVQKEKKKIFAVLGTVFSSATIMGLILLMVVGLLYG